MTKLKKILPHRCCERCLKEGKIRLAQYGISLTKKGMLSNSMELICKNHWKEHKKEMEMKGFISYPYFYIGDHIQHTQQFNLRIDEL